MDQLGAQIAHACIPCFSLLQVSNLLGFVTCFAQASGKDYWHIVLFFPSVIVYLFQRDTWHGGYVSRGACQTVGFFCKRSYRGKVNYCFLLT